MDTKIRFQTRSTQAFSVVELMIVVGIMMIIAAMAVIGIRGAMPSLKANANLSQLIGTLREARETAIGQRRNIQINFLGNNQIQITRIDITGNLTSGTTVLNTVTLANQMQFTLMPGVADTPDGFGNASATDFGGSPTLRFMSDGTFVDANGAPLNGSIFIGIPNQPNTARAATILGATGRIRGYKWNGSTWVE